MTQMIACDVQVHLETGTRRATATLQRQIHCIRELSETFFRDGGEDSGTIAEVVIRGLMTDPRTPGDIPHGNGVWPCRGTDVYCRIEDLSTDIHSLSILDNVKYVG